MGSVLIAGERFGVIRDAFLKRGHQAISCDLVNTEVAGPHIISDYLALDWLAFDIVIVHPTCTALTVSGNAHYAGTQARKNAVDHIAEIWSKPVKRLCLENPVGVINTALDYMPRPQYIQPYEFGSNASKKTGLWLKNLPPLKKHDTLYVPGRVVEYNGKTYRRWANQTDSGQNKLSPGKERAMKRAKTYPGIAMEMALQWGNLLD